MSEVVYLVIQFDSQIVCIPFVNLKLLDSYTMMYDNLLELAASINKTLNLGISNYEIQDVYLSERIDKINDDSQGFKKRYLEVMYSRDSFEYSELESKLASYIKHNIDRLEEFIGLDLVINRYRHKYENIHLFSDDDIDKIAKLYLGTFYKRHKECFFKLKDKKYSFKMQMKEIDYKRMSLEEADREDLEMLIRTTNMRLDELKEFALDHRMVLKR